MRSIVFAAAGTCGQRCTTLRRLIVHESIADELRDRILADIPAAADRRSATRRRAGRAADRRARRSTRWKRALAAAEKQGGKVHGGGRVTDGVPAGGYYVRPALVEISADAPIIQQETFAPILYLMRYRELDEAIRIHNGVPQGLSSAILTRDVREAERFCSAAGSDCGIVERERRHQRRGNRRRVRRRKGNRRRPRIGQRLLEGLHAPRHQHRQLFRRPAAGAGH